MRSVEGGEYRHWVDRSHAYQHIISDFEIGVYEVTYALWYEVRLWALNHGYRFVHPGTEGLDGTPGAAPVGPVGQPVSGISWRDAVVWSNALSEYRELRPVYYADPSRETVLRNASLPVARGPVADWNAEGFRLPTESEWLYVAAFPREGPYWQDGTYWNINCVPGDLPLILSEEPGAYAWYQENAGGQTMPVGLLEASSLGAFDLGGNVWELVWDWWAPAASLGGGPVREDYRGPSSGTERVRRGGSVLNAVSSVIAGARQKSSPAAVAPATGFRLARSGGSSGGE